MNRFPLALAASALVALLASGCYTTTVSSGRPSAGAPIAYDNRQQNGVVVGMGELDGPHDLSAICPAGWSEIKTETSFPNGIATLITGSMYSPQTVTVTCAALPAPAGGVRPGGHVPPPPPPGAMPPPPPPAAPPGPGATQPGQPPPPPPAAPAPPPAATGKQP